MVQFDDHRSVRARRRLSAANLIVDKLGYDGDFWRFLGGLNDNLSGVVAGVPARPVGRPGSALPGVTMEQTTIETDYVV